jgi:hypothetical protein
MSDKNGNSCSTCLNYQFDEGENRLCCNLDQQTERECNRSYFDMREYKYWKPDNTMGLPKYARIKSQEIFGKLKAKIFNVLEAQIPPEPNDRRLNAAKSITEDIISSITEDVKSAILNSNSINK